MEVQPLTRRKRDGKLYKRPPDVTAQIERALQVDIESLLDQVRISDSSSPQHIKAECLVYLIRHFRRGKHEAIVIQLSEILIDRIDQWVKHGLRALDQDNSSDGFNDVIGGVFEEILDIESDRGDFFQVKFWRALKTKTISAYRGFTKQYKRDLETLSLPLDEDEGELVNRTDNPWEALPDQNLLPEQQIITNEGVNSISEPYRTAYILHKLLDFQIESQDSTEPTVSNMLGKTSRTIHNWLVKAEEQLEKWRNSL